MKKKSLFKRVSGVLKKTPVNTPLTLLNRDFFFIFICIYYISFYKSKLIVSIERQRWQKYFSYEIFNTNYFSKNIMIIIYF